MRLRPLRSFAALALTASTLAAQPARAEDAPRPAAELARMTALAGAWEGSGTLAVDGQTSTLKARHETRVIAGGFGVQVHEVMDSPLIGHYEAENILGQDPGTGRTHLYTVDNAADVHDHAGAWADAHTLKLRHVGVVDGKRYVEDVSLTVTGADRYTIRLHSTLGGKPHESGELDMHRVMMSNR